MNKGFASLGLILPILASCSSTRVEEQEQKKPNIIFLLADDMGYGEPGCYGQEVIKTPFLDSLAAAGMRFTNFYAGSSVCSPSRASLMTGKHTGHTSIRGNVGFYPDGSWYRVPLQPNEITLGEHLKSAGYQTGFIGKWHLEDPDLHETWAISRGFDYVLQEQWPEKTRPGGRKFDEREHWLNGWTESVRYDNQQYDCIDDFRTDYAMKFLDQKDDRKPFFLFMSYRTPHGHETYIRNKDLYSEYGWNEKERRHAARITMLDAAMKRLFNRLKADGELENTLIIFSSDNGPTNEGHSYKFFNSNGGLRGYKRDIYEGGIRIPMIAFWQGKIQPGTISDHPSAFYDVMPTFAEAAGIAPPEGIDGISFMPELLGREQPVHEYMYWEITERGNDKIQGDGFRQAVRFGKWKAVKKGMNGSLELYDLVIDKQEAKNLAAQHPELVIKATHYLKSARTENPNFPYGGTNTNR